MRYGKTYVKPMMFDSCAERTCYNIRFTHVALFAVSHLHVQQASVNRVAALTSLDGILQDQGIPKVKNRLRESIKNAYYLLNKGCRRDKLVMRSITVVLWTQSMLFNV